MLHIVTAKKDRIFGLDAMRFMAIVLVLVAHSNAFLIEKHPNLKELLTFSGYIGVEIFFVLSGFLIGGIIIGGYQKKMNLVQFLIRRWFRTLPNYYLFLFINFFIYFLILKRPVGDYKFILLSQNILYGFDVFFYPESWSLTIEEWFYLITPVLIAVLFRINRNAKFSILSGVLIILLFSLAGRCLYVLLKNPLWSDVRQIAFVRFDSLMLGVLGAFMKNYLYNFWNESKYYSFFLGIILLIYVAISFFGFDLNQSFSTRTTFFTVTSLAILCFLPLLAAWGKAGSSSNNIYRTMTTISILSYSLYLSHLPIRELFIVSCKAMGLNYIEHSFVAISVWLGSTVLVSYLIYNYYEYPMMQLREKF